MRGIAELRDRWRVFGAWRRDRPFWGGVLTIAAAVELVALIAAPLQIMLIRGLAGIGTLVLAAMLIALAIISWTHAQLRVICGVFIVILGLASFAVSNLGGFFLGLLLALIGGSLIFAWRPADPGDEAGPDAPADTGEQQVDAAEDAEPEPDTTADTEEVPVAEADAEPDRKPSPHPRGRTALVVLALATAAVLTTPPTPAAAAEPVLPCPSWWPWCDEDTDPPGDGEPDDGDSSDDGDDTDDPDKPGDDEKPPKPDEECDRSALPARPPKLGTEQAETVAKVLAACLKPSGESETGGGAPPTAGVHRPVLDAEVMTMSSLKPDGVTQVPTADGRVSALEFGMDALELADMDQSAGIDGTDARLHVINSGSTAVLSGGVRLYVERMEGLIFGVIPIVLTADTPLPPIPIPYLVITQAKVDTLYTRADRVELPDLDEPTR